MEFVGFPKIARLSRLCVITEKLDGTNAQVVITTDFNAETPATAVVGDYAMLVGSRNRWITPEDDNYVFAKWARAHADELVNGLGPGQHFGEWWGQGIQRGYGLSEKRFSLFNTARWADDALRPACCHSVPVLYKGEFDVDVVRDCLADLRRLGSVAAPDFPNPEGVIVWHEAARQYFKKTLLKDEEPKGRS